MTAFTRVKASWTFFALLLTAMSAADSRAGAGYSIQSPNTALTGLVSGDTVRINITGPSTALILRSAVTLNGNNVTWALQPDGASGSMTGNVSGLKVGSNTFQLFASKTSLVPVAQLVIERGTAPGVACASLTNVAAALPVQPTTLTLVQLNAATPTLPEHCQIDGDINRRIGVDGRSYGIRFRLRLPTAWNGRFYMGGGGGSNGTLVDPTNVLPQGFATIGTDSGHDNSIDTDANAGGGAAFGRDPQARLDHGYNSHDSVTRVGKFLIDAYYGRPADKSYFVGCSEGGREAFMLSQRFPTHYDGIVAGDPGYRLPITAANTQLFIRTLAPLAIAAGQFDASGIPLINKTFTDGDFQLIANTVLSACDALDGLVDGMSNNLAACSNAVVLPALTTLTCSGPKTASCLSSSQLSALETMFASLKNSQGSEIYSGFPWDPGIGGMNGASFNNGFRQWWFGTFNSATNNAQKITLSSGLHALVWITPPDIVPTAQLFNYELDFSIDTDFPRTFETSGIYTQSAAQFAIADSTNLSAFKNNGGKLLVYHGNADAAFSVDDTIKWYNAMNAVMGGTATTFARLFTVPGMNHCGGGPGPNTFDAVTALSNWVENAVAPDSVVASASNPGFFGLASRTRPLCPYPQWAH